MTNRIFTPPADFATRLIREGDPHTQYAMNTVAVTVVTGAVNVSLNVTAQGPGLVGKAVWIEEITVSLSSPGIAQIQIPASTDTLFPGLIKQVIVGTTPVTIPVRMIVRGFTHSNNGNITLNVRNNLTAGSVDYYGTVSATGYRITDDFDYDAEKTILFIMDSIGNGTGPTKTANMWPFLFKKHLRELSNDARVVLKSVSSSKSTDWSGYLSAGYADIAEADLIIYTPSVNDAGAAVSNETYTTALQSFWDWKQRQFSSAHAIITGTTPLENNTSETRAVGLRTAASTFVSDINHSNLHYINNGSRFDRTVSTNYASTDTPGSRVHPNDAGHSSIASGFITDYDALNIII